MTESTTTQLGRPVLQAKRFLLNETTEGEEVSAATITNGEILSRHKIAPEGIEHLDLEVPMLTGPQRQGDILVVPCEPPKDLGKLISARGVIVVRGETSGGNAHILHALDGECYWSPSPTADTKLIQGCLTVGDDSAATLLHTQEHNVIGVGPGFYEIRRQREYQGEWRRVSD
jgi:hypothetical protein